MGQYARYPSENSITSGGQYAVYPAPTSYVLINPIVSTVSIASPLVFLQHDMELTGTLTLLGTSELLVI